MIYIFSKRFIKILHFIRIGFKRLFIIAAVLVSGTALLSAYTLINIVNSISATYKDRPAALLFSIILLAAIPTSASILEKGLNSYVYNKNKKLSSSN
jgi:hypothetical protein